MHKVVGDWRGLTCCAISTLSRGLYITSSGRPTCNKDDEDQYGSTRPTGAAPRGRAMYFNMSSLWLCHTVQPCTHIYLGTTGTGCVRQRGGCTCSSTMTIKYHTALKYLWPHTMDLLQLQNIDIEQAAQISTATAEYHAATALRTLPSSSSK